MVHNKRSQKVKLDRGNQFTLSVRVNDKSAASTSVFLNGKLVDFEKESFALSISNVNAGDHVYVITTHSDLQQSTNRLVVEHSINPSDAKVIFDNIANEGELVIDSTRFEFC